ncbi:GPO family capsid scaffolding protein [Burkholderia gladioli]|uniref:GPO family capsid scaffolding protein n=1 Tax=Burkholderia gladioli TaxID=28095 RepID=UPI00163E483B|nr:GPO family capsid scaffolding protein [Burkholderia gladioli]
MAKKSKPFRVAVEGATVDGREIQRDWLTQAAANYDPELYGARMNVEHVKGWAPMSATNPFGAYGDVIALTASVIEDGPLKGKMGLYAEIDPVPELVEMNKKRQKIYTSIEINPSFADTGEAYLVGLAATDDPASLGTEALQFAARRSSNVHSAAHETAIEFEGESDEPSVLSFVKGLFARNRATDETRNADMRQAIEEVAAFCLLINTGHVMDHLAHTSALRDKWNGLPVKSDRVFKAQLKHAGVVVGDKEVERRVYTRRVRYLTPISVDRLASYGLHVSIREDLASDAMQGAA